MKRHFMAALMVVAMAGFTGCDGEADETTDTGPDSSVAGTWSGTMKATRFMGQPVAAGDSEVVPFTMSISQSGGDIDVSFQANEYPGFFTGTFSKSDGYIQFSATADYKYQFFGYVGFGNRSITGQWSVNIPGGMGGTWQASR